MIFELGIKSLAGSAAIALIVINFAQYMAGVLRGRTKPHFYTWLVWGMVMGIAAVAQFDAGAGTGAWVTLMGACGAFARAAAAIWYGVSASGKSDQICLLGCLMAIVLWRLTGNPLVAIVIVTLIDMAAVIPTARHAWHKPHDENATTYFLFGVQFTLAIVALESYNFITLVYPVIIAVSSYGFGAFLLWRRAAAKQPALNEGM
ncbi:MAG: hypothetical protein AB7G06_09130 [Bdellovibrionales bacterium]